MSDETFDDEEEFDPEEAERSIAEFITNADALDGPSTQEVAARVLAEVAASQERIGVILGDQPTNKIIATMLFLSRQHRDAIDTNTLLQWRLSAAGTLVSGFIRPGED